MEEDYFSDFTLEDCAIFLNNLNLELSKEGDLNLHFANNLLASLRIALRNHIKVYTDKTEFEKKALSSKEM